MTTGGDSPELGPDSRVEFFALRTRAEDDGSVVVGRADTGDFVALPALGALIIRELDSGTRIAEVEEHLSARGTEIDVAGFVTQLGEFGFVRAVDGVSSPDVPAIWPPTWPWLKACHVRWMFTLPAYTVYLLVVTAAVTALILQPRVRPRYGDIFFSGSTSLVLAGSTALFLVIVAFHEFAHLASARASDVPGRITLGTRLYWLAVQTDVSGMWAASPRERLRTYLAGMGMDLVLGSALVLERTVCVFGGAVDHVIAAAVVLIIIGVAGQFELFVRSDMYFVAAHLLKARNLFEDATLQCIHVLRSLIGKAPRVHPLAGLPDRERRVVRGYSLVMVIGTAAALTIFAEYLFPAIIILLARGVHRLTEGLSHGNAPLALDGGVTVVVEGGFELLVAVLILRSRMPWINALRARSRLRS